MYTCLKSWKVRPCSITSCVSLSNVHLNYFLYLSFFLYHLSIVSSLSFIVHISILKPNRNSFTKLSLHSHWSNCYLYPSIQLLPPSNPQFLCTYILSICAYFSHALARRQAHSPVQKLCLLPKIWASLSPSLLMLETAAADWSERRLTLGQGIFN